MKYPKRPPRIPPQLRLNWSEGADIACPGCGKSTSRSIVTQRGSGFSRSRIIGRGDSFSINFPRCIGCRSELRVRRCEWPAHFRYTLSFHPYRGTPKWRKGHTS